MKFHPFRDETKWVEKKIYPIFSPNLIKPMILYLEIKIEIEIIWQLKHFPIVKLEREVWI